MTEQTQPAAPYTPEDETAAVAEEQARLDAAQAEWLRHRVVDLNATCRALSARLEDALATIDTQAETIAGLQAHLDASLADDQDTPEDAGNEDGGGQGATLDPMSTEPAEGQESAP